MKTIGVSGSYFTYLKTRPPKIQGFRPLTPVKDLKIQWPTFIKDNNYKLFW